MEAMAGFEDKFFDLAVVDPPYGIGNFVQITGNVRGKSLKWNDTIPDKKYFDELKRVSKHQIIWGANYYNCFNGRGGAIIWNKGVPRESNMSVCEIASYSRLARVDYIDLKWQNINRNEETIHPCQKPIKLYTTLFNRYAKPRFKILDTHLGSGSSRIAAHKAGLDFWGYELDSDYFAAQEKRFNNYRSQLTLAL